MSHCLAADRPETERVSDRVAERLLDLIATGAIAPGERLPGERQLAQQMGVSRVSVRAALQSLKTQGFLSAVQGGGTRVLSTAGQMDSPLVHLTRLNRENLHDLAQLRAVMEEWAAAHAAEHRSDEQLAELEDVLVSMARPNAKPEQKSQDDVRFHLTVAKASGSAVYLHIVSTIRDILQESLNYHRYQMFATENDDRILLAQHRAIADAIRARDGVTAGRAMRDHLNWVNARYEHEHDRLSR